MQEVKTEKNIEIKYPAHIREDKAIQTVSEHCIGTAEITSEIMKKVSCENLGKFVGLLHDMGKYTSDFSEYITKASRGESVQRGSVNHTFAGVKYILETYRKRDEFWKSITSEMAAYAVGAHHGLFDCVDENSKNGFIHRLNDSNVSYKEAKNNFFNDCINENEISEIFSKANAEVKNFLEKYNNIKMEKSESELGFYFGLTARLILSCVIDGDRIDTACFMLGRRKEEYLGISTFSENAKALFWNNLSEKVDKALSVYEKESTIAKTRNTISNSCFEAGSVENGIYRLNIPTGGGKTLSSLRFAINNSKLYKKDRIIIVTPLLSIIDQNSKIIKDIIGDENIILEHHSNVVNEDYESDMWDKREKMIENWNAPIIITTLVQFLNTLFGGQTSNIRRFHALCNSVIIIDEVQTVPLKILSMFNLDMNFISYFCNSTIVLCSATQPCYQAIKHAMYVKGDLVKIEKDVEDVFDRTKIIYRGEKTASQIVDELKVLYESNRSILVVCNTKQIAEEIFKSLRSIYENVLYLSTSLCMEHRKEVIETIKEKINQNEKIICVSTQVIEAGVDLSFECAVRLTAGLDNIIQVAGRCNRSGEYGDKMPIYVFTCIDEKLEMLRDIERQKTATTDLLYCYAKNSELFDENLASVKATDFYYKSLYKELSEDYFDNCVGNLSLYDLLSVNTKYADSDSEGMNDNYQLRQAFKKAAALFSVFDSNTIDVLVPFKGGIDVIAGLNSESVNYDSVYKKELIDKGKSYTVSLYSYQVKILQEKGGIYSICNEEALALKNIFYNEETGLDIEGNGNIYMEV